MPLYEYQCQKCGERVEAIQKLSDPPYTICPHCGGELKKLISSPAIQFKGSGFYITDYARAGSKSETKESTKEGSSGESAKSEGSKTEKIEKPAPAKPSGSSS
jgi:putative FmdB family regulatory protein